MTLCKRAGKNKSNAFFISTDLHPQTIDVVTTRAKYVGFEIITGSAEDLEKYDVFGALLQYPASNGELLDLTDIIEAAA